MLKRYWFVIYPENRFGQGNIGVTDYSKEQARLSIAETFKRFNLTDMISNLDDKTEVIENIDVRLLEQNHVRPNMGVVTRKGVWFPNLNQYLI